MITNNDRKLLRGKPQLMRMVKEQLESQQAVREKYERTAKRLRISKIHCVYRINAPHFDFDGASELPKV